MNSLTSSDLIIRPGDRDDLAALTDIYNHYVLTSHATFDVEPVDAEDRLEWLAQFDTSGPHRLVVASAPDGHVLGYASSTRYQARAAYARSVATSVYCSPDAVGRGVGAALYSALFDALSGTGLHRAIAGIALPNPASLRLHERFGFREIGTQSEVGFKFDRFWDVLLLERELV